MVLAANYLALGELHPALHEYERVLMLRERDGEGPAVVDTLLQLAFVSIQLQQLDRAREYLDRVRALSDHGVDDLVRARTLELTGLLARWESRYADALRDVDAAIELRTRRSPSDQANVVALQVRGDAFMLMGDVTAAQRTWTEALELSQRTVGVENRDGAEILRRLGLAAFAVGNLQDARRFREEGLRIAESAVGPCDRALTSAMASAATSRQYDGQYADARSLLRRAQRGDLEVCAGGAGIGVCHGVGGSRRRVSRGRRRSGTVRPVPRAE